MADIHYHSKRRFSAFVNASGEVFVILETPGYGLTYQESWDRARSQLLPVVIEFKNGRREVPGLSFDALVFERVVYGLYLNSPVGEEETFEGFQKFESWVEDFRKAPRTHLVDVPEYVRRSVDTYRALTATQTGRAVA